MSSTDTLNCVYLYNNFKTFDAKNNNISIIDLYNNYNKTDNKCVISYSEIPSHKNISLKIRKSYVYTDYLFISFLLAFLLLAFVFVRYAKYLKLYVQALIYDITSTKLVDDYSVPVVKLGTYLNVLVLFTVLISFVTFKQYYDNTGEIDLISLAYFLIVFLLYRFWTITLNKLILFITQDRATLNVLNLDNSLVFRLLSLVVLPLLFFLNYIVPNFQLPILYFTISIILIALLYRYFIFAKIFITNKVSLLYYILYLCALEMPLILGITYLLRES
jgi:hypothetical protein